MEGLEVSVLMLSETKLDNEKFRLDDKFFEKRYREAYALIKTKAHVNFGSIMSTLSDYHANGSYESLNKVVSILDKPDYAYMVRSTDLEKRDFVSDVKYIDEAAYLHLTKTKLFGGELLINKIGNPGRVYYMPLLNRPATVGMNLFMVKLNIEFGFKEKFIWAFFNSDFGQKIIQRKVNGTVPLTIDKEAIRTLYIPKLERYFQEKIEDVVSSSDQIKVYSQEKYLSAETLLLETLGLTDFKPRTEAVNIKSLKDSFGTTGRLDAEYYQPKYEHMMARITSSSHAKLGELVDMKKSIEPGSDAYAEDEEGLPFLRVADYSKQGITSPQVRLNKKFVVENFEKIADLKPKQDTILFSKDGSVGEAYRLREDADFITSGAILHLTVKNKAQVLPDYLALALNSIAVKQQAERDAGGSIILHWRKEEIENVLVPIVDMPTQQKIEAQIQESFKLKAESERLLEVAKRAVEIAVEQSEQAGLEFITQQTK